MEGLKIVSCQPDIFISLSNQFGGKLVADSDSGHFFK